MATKRIIPPPVQSAANSFCRTPSAIAALEAKLNANAKSTTFAIEVRQAQGYHAAALDLLLGMKEVMTSLLNPNSATRTDAGMLTPSVMEQKEKLAEMLEHYGFKIISHPKLVGHGLLVLDFPDTDGEF